MPQTGGGLNCGERETSKHPPICCILFSRHSSKLYFLFFYHCPEASCAVIYQVDWKFWPQRKLQESDVCSDALGSTRLNGCESSNLSVRFFQAVLIPSLCRQYWHPSPYLCALLLYFQLSLIVCGLERQVLLLIWTVLSDRLAPAFSRAVPLLKPQGPRLPVNLSESRLYLTRGLIYIGLDDGFSMQWGDWGGPSIF